MLSPATDKTIKQFKKANLSLEDRTALLTSILGELKVLPLNDTIVIGQGFIKVNGKELDPEQIINFQESCNALKSNFAWQVISEQMRYLATNLGVYKATNLDELYFYKSALWILDQINKLLEKIV